MRLIEKDERDLLEVLRAELDFLEKGGYGRSPREPWLRPMIFQDSPACMNFDCKENPGPCNECVLMKLVAPEQCLGDTPCYQIPLNAAGDTLESLYRFAEDREIEDVYGKWLHEVIGRLEQLTDVPSPAVPIARVAAPVQGIPLRQSITPKCANPACPGAFSWRAGGKFFRFRDYECPRDESCCRNTPAVPICSAVKHYWLCDVCSRTYTLAHCEEHGVVVKLRDDALTGALPERASAA